MFAAISRWFQGQTNTLDRQHAKVSWEEALDNAVHKISQLKDVESERGRELLGKIIDELKLVQFSTQSLLDEINFSERGANNNNDDDDNQEGGD